MTREDTEKLLMVTYGAVLREFGRIDDLPYEFANTIANIYFRYYQQGIPSAPPISTDEWARRQADFITINRSVPELRRLAGKQDVPEWGIDIAISTVIDLLKYRMKDVEKKSAIRRKIERAFLSDHNLPNLARDLSLHK